MTGTWIVLVLFANTLAVQVLPQEFPNEKECWNWMRRVITITKKETHLRHQRLICVSSIHMKGNDITGMIAPLTIILPPPSAS
jgi:hypothetical protein